MAHPLPACLRKACKGRVLQGFGACGTGLRPPFHPLARPKVLKAASWFELSIC